MMRRESTLAIGMVNQPRKQNVQVREEEEFYLYETYIRYASLVSVAALLAVWVVSRMRK